MRGDRKQGKKQRSILGNNLFAIRWLMRITPGYTAYLIITSVFNELLILFEHTFLVAYLVGCIEEHRPAADALTVLALFVVFGILYNVGQNFVDGYAAPGANAKIRKEIHLTLYRKAVDMEISRYDNAEFYNDFVWAMQKAPAHITGALTTFNSLAGQIAAAVAAGAYVISADIMALLVAAVTLAFSLACQFAGNRLRMRREEESLPHTRRRDYINRVYYLADYVKDLKMSRMAENLERDFDQATEQIKSIAAKRGNALTANEAVMSAAQNVIYYGLYLSWLFYAALVKHRFGMGTLLASFNSVNRIRNSITTVTGKLPEFQEHSMYIEKLRTFLDTGNRMQDGEKSVPERGDIRLENVRFTYEGNAEPALKNISMHIRKGQKVALVGFNGAGKSTLVKLLLRFYDAEKGKITYAGEEIRNYKIKEYRSQFGVLFQDFEIFATDIRGNLTMSDCNLNEKKAEEVLKKAGFWERFQKMPRGYDTPLTKEFAADGVELSGGEAQKLALARVLYADTGIIVMDEPSSALDPIAEYELNRTITELAEDRTVIIISHRLSTTRFMDKIYMLENGEIIEQGTHESLLAQNGAYAEMFRLQAEKYR